MNTSTAQKEAVSRACALQPELEDFIYALAMVALSADVDASECALFLSTAVKYADIAVDLAEWVRLYASWGES